MRYVFRIGWTALAAMTVAACSDNPRNQQVLPAPNAQFRWSGWVVDPNETITLKVRDQSDGSWDTRWTATTSASGQSDGSLTWFPFTTNTATLRYGTASSHTKYWKMISNQGTQRRMAAEVKSSSPARGDLVTFDVGADACINAQETGLEIASNCDSSASPVATMIAHCGKSNQACCLARDAAPAERCDRGRNCNSSSLTCSIPAGGLHQPCYADGRCDNTSMQCVDGTCRDMIQRAPVLLSKLVVHTCDRSGAGTTDEIWVRLRNDMFYLDHPGTDAGRNQTDTWGLAIPDIDAVSDISNLAIGTVDGDDPWCVDRVDLFINGARVFTKSYGSGVWIQRIDDPILSTFPEMLVADEGTIRDALDAANRTQVCTLPPSFSYADLESAIAGMLGDAFARSRIDLTSDDRKFNASWGSFRPIITREDASTLAVAIRFRATATMADPAPDFDITGDIKVRASATCALVSASGTGSATNPTSFSSCETDFDSSVVVTRAVGIPDSGLPIVGDIVAWIASDRIGTLAQRAVREFPDLHGYFETSQAMACGFDPNHQFCDPNGDVCSCPNINVGASSISFNWTSLSALPNLLCLF